MLFMNYENMWESKKTNYKCWRKSVSSCICNSIYTTVMKRVKRGKKSSIFTKILKYHDIKQKNNLTSICFNLKWSDFKEYTIATYRINIATCGESFFSSYLWRISLKPLKFFIYYFFFFLLLSSCEINIYIIILMVFLKSNFLCINSHETWNMCWCTLLSYCHALKIYTFVLMIIQLVTY